MNGLVKFVVGLIWTVPAFYLGRISAWNKAIKMIEEMQKQIRNFGEENASKNI